MGARIGSDAKKLQYFLLHNHPPSTEMVASSRDGAIDLQFPRIMQENRDRIPARKYLAVVPTSHALILLLFNEMGAGRPSNLSFAEIQKKTLLSPVFLSPILRLLSSHAKSQFLVKTTSANGEEASDLYSSNECFKSDRFDITVSAVESTRSVDRREELERHLQNS